MKKERRPSPTVGLPQRRTTTTQLPWVIGPFLPTRFYPEQLDTNSKLDHPDLTQS